MRCPPTIACSYGSCLLRSCIDGLKPFQGGEEDYGYAELYGSVDCIILGRRTYEQCLSFPEWPYPGKACWIFSRSMSAASESAVRFSAGPPSTAVKQMAAEGRRRAWLAGGGKLAAAFRAERLITEYIVSVIPVLLGAGIPLFDGAASKQDLALAAVQNYASGIEQLRYVNP